MKQYKVLQRAFSFLKKHQREENVANELLQHLTKANSAQFYANMQASLDQKLIEQFEKHLRDHAIKGRPIQHIIGRAPFYGREFFVNEAVLIPRFETEEVVLASLEKITHRIGEGPLIAVDLGTGSGIIAITLALENKDLKVYATDISRAALQVAKKNAKHHDAPVEFYLGDFLQPLMERAIVPDIIISNPPYISHEERVNLADTVEKFDPALALFAEDDGLAAYKKIVKQLQCIQKEGQLLVFEIGYQQGEAVKKIVEAAFPDSKVAILQDINQLDRIVIAEI